MEKNDRSGSSENRTALFDHRVTPQCKSISFDISIERQFLGFEEVNDVFLGAFKQAVCSCFGCQSAFSDQTTTGHYFCGPLHMHQYIIPRQLVIFILKVVRMSKKCS